MIKKALNLFPKEKTQIIEALLLSLDHPDSKIEEIWNTEIDRRLDAENTLIHGRKTRLNFATRPALYEVCRSVV